MRLTISHKNPEVLKEYLVCALNIACIVAGHGNIPTELEQKSPEQYGRYWWREYNRFHLYSTSNDWIANILEETENSITLSFYKRHDTNGCADALANLIALRMPDVTTIN